MDLKIMPNTESTVEILLSSLLKGFYSKSSTQYKAIGFVFNKANILS